METSALLCLSHERLTSNSFPTFSPTSLTAHPKPQQEESTLTVKVDVSLVLDLERICLSPCFGQT